ARIRPSRDVAGGEDARKAGLEILVDDHAAVDRRSRTLGKRRSRPNPDADDDEIGLERSAAAETHLGPIDGRDRLFEMEDRAARLVQRPHELADLRAEHALHRPLLRSDDVDLEAPRA